MKNTNFAISKALVENELLDRLINMDPKKFKYIVSLLVARKFPYSRLSSEVKDLPKGIHMVGSCPDIFNPPKQKMICVRIKQSSLEMTKPDFSRIGFQTYLTHKDKSDLYSTGIGILVCLGDTPYSVKKVQNKFKMPNLEYLYWDRQKVLAMLLEFGLGINYQIDSDFWDLFEDGDIPLV